MRHFLVEEKALRSGDDHHSIDPLALDGTHPPFSFLFDDLYFHVDSFRSNNNFVNFSDDNDLDLDPESCNPRERALFWDTQKALLQELVERYHLSGTKLRQEVLRTIEKARATDYCKCAKLSPSFDGCARCFRQKVVHLLSDKGFDAALCTSTWKSTKKFPGGSHEYIKLMTNTSGRKKQISFIIELEFRNEFEIVKGCKEYHKLINLVPKYYIGKSDYLNAIIRLLCQAVKKSMKEKNMHVGPWRKKSFMQMKWSGSRDPANPNRRSFNSSSANLDECSNKFGRHDPRQGTNHTYTVYNAPSVVIVT